MNITIHNRNNYSRCHEKLMCCSPNTPKLLPFVSQFLQAEKTGSRIVAWPKSEPRTARPERQHI